MTPLHCSFCGKSQHEVRKLIAGPTTFICDECTALCMDIINENFSPDIPALVSAGRLSVYEAAHLRIAAFAALKGWGSTEADGKFKTWNWVKLEEKASVLVGWAASIRERPITPMHPGDLGIEEKANG